MRSLVVTAALLSVTACTTGASGDKSDQPSAAESVQLTCDEVLAGIAAFNRQDYAATVKYFEQAVPAARAYVEAEPGPEAEALLEAVRYYAGLAPRRYPDAARSSADFARHKTVTLNQCAAGEPIDSAPDTAV